jgi:hypothetical protein
MTKGVVVSTSHPGHTHSTSKPPPLPAAAQKHLRKHPNPDRQQPADPGDGADRPRVRQFFGDRRSQPQSRARHEARDGLAHHHVFGEFAHRIPPAVGGKGSGPTTSQGLGRCESAGVGFLLVASARAGVEGIREDGCWWPGGKDGEGMDVCFWEVAWEGLRCFMLVNILI